MIRELVDYGTKIRKNHEALKFEPISIDLIINEDGSFARFSVIQRIFRLAEALTVKKGHARLLLDRAEEVICYLSEKEIKNNNNDVTKAREKVYAKHKLFLSKLNEYKELEVLTPVFLFYYDNSKNGITVAKKEFEQQVPESERGGNIAFRINDMRLHEQKAVHDAIIEKYEKSIAKSLEPNTPFCSVCGRNKYPIARLHEKIKGLPPYNDGKSNNRLMISYNKNSFLSYGLTQSTNSRICTNCAKNYTEALNNLIENKQQRKKFGYDTTVVYWTRENTELGELDLLDKPDPEAVGMLINSIATGKQDVSGNFETNRFYSLTLSGAAARIAVRDWIEIGLDEYKKNIAIWFEDIAIKAYGVIQYASIYQLADSCHKMSKSSKDNDPVISRVATYLWNSALKSDSIPPLWILTAVLKRIRVIEMTDDGRSRETMTPVRASLIRLILNRNFKYKKGYTMQKEELDPENKNPSYLCGRIFAVMEGIQRAALGKNLNAGIRERFFSAASTNPSPAFGRLMRLSQNHLSKLKQEKPGVAVILDRELQYLCSAISAFPAILSLEEQGQFALGYYHQKQYDFDRAKKHEEFKSITENMED
ncbi:MAG: type I-C CRISPR-associated protein Cas8c/Csd1 [Deltaproteobacteria bacterium]|nr:type I-C CRISPR-associated protein Cas8c/Csd1 [Deltaproteobacteria bacterium]